MSDPVAIVTGAGRGIGRATAIELASAGYDLLLTARNEKELAQTVSLAGRGQFIVADISDPDTSVKLAEHCIRSFGRIDAIVNNAGSAPRLEVEHTTPEVWRQTIETNLSAAFYLSQAAWPTFKSRQSGVIVNISSLSTRDPFSGFAAYAAAKAGLNVLGLVLAREGEPFGIRVHTLALGAVETTMFRQLLSVDEYPVTKTLDPTDVAVIIRQCIDGTLRYTSGEVIYLHKTL